jgi:threonine dehydrogenase-like Zn-dependent dehydrogenase
MSHLVFTAPARLEWREHPSPVLDSGHAALVRPVAVATCDLDALIIQGASPFAPPFPIGHECVAEVVEISDAGAVRRARPARQRPLPDLLRNVPGMPAGAVS